MNFMRTLVLSLMLGTLISIPTYAAENPDGQSLQEIEHARAVIQRDFSHSVLPESLSTQQRAQILEHYAYIDTEHAIPQDLLARALVYFDANKDSFPNQDFITIVDFTPRSDNYRFFVVHMVDGSVERYHTTHGIGSDPNNSGTAQKFGNVVNSGMSSVGFVRTAEVYSGKFKRSIRIDGLSDTNSKIRERAVVIHGWDNVKEEDVIQKRSWGCMTLDWSVKDEVIDEIKEGSLLYADQSTPSQTP